MHSAFALTFSRELEQPFWKLQKFEKILSETVLKQYKKCFKHADRAEKAEY